MVESLSELNDRVQKPQYKEVGNWMVRKILRPAALPLTWLLLHTPVTANQVTLAALLTGLLGIALCAAVGKGFYLAGMLLIQFWYLLDHVDGQIARYRGTSCLTGRFFDFLMHHILHGVFFFAPACFLYFKYGSFFWVLWGFVTAFCMTGFNMLHDIKYKTFFEYLSKAPGAVKQPAPGASAGQARNPTGGHKAFSQAHKLIEMHVLMNLFTLSAFLDFFFRFETRAALFLVYGLLVPFCFAAKTTAWVLSRKIDTEFNAQAWKD